MAAENPPKEPPKSDLSLPELKRQAKLGLLRVDPTVAKECAEAANIAIGNILAILKVVESKASSLPALGNLKSSSVLQDAFNDRAKSLAKVLNSHVKLLTDLAQGFLDAGKAYVEIDESNADALKNLNIAINKSPGNLPEPDLTKHKGPETKVPDKPPASGGEVATVYPETSNSLNWDQLYGLGVALGGPRKVKTTLTWKKSGTDTDKTALVTESAIANKVAEVGSIWGWAADKVFYTGDDLDKALRKATEEKWRGEGAKAAAEAVLRYKNITDDLSKPMKTMESNLGYTAQWLHSTMNAMPQAPAATDPRASCDLEKYQNEYKSHYVDGVNHSATLFVKLGDPMVGQGGGGTSPAGPGGGKKPNDGSGGSPGTGGPGTGSTADDFYKSLLDKMKGEGGGPGGGLGGGPGPGLGAGPGGGLGKGGGPGGGAPPPKVGVPKPPSLGPGPGIGGPPVPKPPVLPPGGLPPGVPLPDGNSPFDPGQQGGIGAGADGLDAAARAAAQGLPGTQALNAMAQADKARSDLAAKSAAEREKAAKTLAGLPGMSGGRAGGGAGVSSSSPLAANQNSKLFPRVALPGVAGATVSAVPGSPMAGMAGPGMAPGAPMGAAGQGKDAGQHKRAKYLDSKKHLEEGFGKLPTGMKAVIEPEQ
ncbi:hypothetical protein [Nocardia altamirensis]|uniref:hypothetical protein n=1 Tax=Nocardia altamirensis TaxID=472158 RepID=UPI000AACB7BE|nr:hypothetical protein [Nocardia altamirensis]